MIFRLLILVTFFTATACSQTNIHDYQGTKPEFNLKDFFDGDLKAYGVLQNRSGKVTRKFEADITASWKGNVGTLDEVFYFDDGETDTRIWTLNLSDDGLVTGTAGDVIGEASGQVKGSAMRWEYVLEVPYGGDLIKVKVDDWLYLINENRLINRSELKKFGFVVGELTLVIEKASTN